MVLATPVLFWGGWPFLRGAWSSLRHRIPTMDLLIAVGTLSAYGYSIASLIMGGKYLYFDTASMLITFLLFSKLLEVSTRNRASGISRLLSRFTAQKVRRLMADGSTSMAAVAQVHPEDRFVVLPGERVALDAVIDEGASAIDESILTGEAVPVDKIPGSVIYAGTMNHTGRLVARALRTQRESLISQIQGYVKEAQESRGPWRTLADRVLRIFVPFVLLMGLGTLFLSHFAGGLAWSASLMRMTAIFVIACPCALSVATPLAIMAGAQRVGRAGILIKSGDALERLAIIDTVGFDKTGTLTNGRMTVREYWPEVPEVIQLGASAELGSEHPIADALVRHAEMQNIPLKAAEEFYTTPGFGIRARIDSRLVEVMRAEDALVTDAELAARVADWRARGYTVSLVMVDGEVFGAVAVADSVRAGAAQAVAALQERGVQLTVLSGDHPDALSRLAAEIAIDDLRGRLKPLEKAAWIEERQAHGAHVLYVGDGINDSPALVKAELGIAMAGGADIAQEAGHLTLTRPSLGAIAEALDTGRMVSRVIRQNLVWAFLYNILALPAAALGYTSPLIAAAAMLVSSAFVLGNSLRILGWSPRRYVIGAASVVFMGGLLFILAWLGI
jgi:Cu2+-exporting ATPase/Cu+-exporting ATPase